MKKFGAIKDLLFVMVATIVGIAGLSLSLRFTNGLMLVGVILFAISIGMWLYFIKKERRS